MANSVVKVTDSMLNDSLLLLVGEDGTVTPDKGTVESFLGSKQGSTNIQIMHINKLDDKSVDVEIDNVVYLPEADDVTVASPMVSSTTMDDVTQNLYHVKLDHDYTPHTLATTSTQDLDDELAKTLSILDGDEVGMEKAPVDSTPPVKKKAPPTKKVVDTPRKAKEKSRRYEDDPDYLDDEVPVDESSINHNKTLRRKSVSKPVAPKPHASKTKVVVLDPPVVEPRVEPSSSKSDDKVVVVKPPTVVKKDKKPPKPTVVPPDDFALFSTPDIIRRVGSSKDNVEEGGSTSPAKIERSKSLTTEVANEKHPRLSLDGKLSNLTTTNSDVKDDNLEMSNTATYEPAPAPQPSSSLTVDATGLDLDPTLLDNINNDIINEDILYQVAQSLVSNTELQNAIDKSLNEGLDPAVLQATLPAPIEQEQQVMAVSTSSAAKPRAGMQIVRPDGRVVVIPPIERPTTRSRNKRLPNVEQKSPATKFAHKPLDDEHVSGNELDSDEEKHATARPQETDPTDEDYVDEDDDDEEESEDDPNKLWCICNQPHNNRFMICCDTCEEWYHGKCVNITKAMGQQMELEGREWICVYCKDRNLKRPQAAARRVRKASRNSRQSTDSSSSSTKARAQQQVAPPQPKQQAKAAMSSVPCIVCQKPSRTSSIFCSEVCILAHAGGVEKVVVFEKSSGKMLTGNKAPSASNLEQWLKDHPGFQVVKSKGKVVTSTPRPKPHPKNPAMTQSKLKLVKNVNNDGVSLAVHKKGVNVGVLKHLPKKTPPRPPGLKIISKVISTTAATVTTPTGPKATTKGPIQIISPPLRKIPQQQQQQQLSKMSPATSTTVTSTPPPKEKSTPVKVKAPRPKSEHTTPPPKQENIRENVQRTVFEQLTKRLKEAKDDALKLTEDELKEISTEIESQLYKCFGDTGMKYKNKFRSLSFNIKDAKNQTLWRRICQKSVSPYQLVRLSPDDLASQELALWREREAKHQLDMIKKSELEMLNSSRQYVLKTHKGEQIVGEGSRPTDHIATTEVITSLTEDETAGKDKDKKSAKHSHRDKDKKSSRGDGHRHSSSSAKKRSRSKERGKHERRRSRSRGRDKHRKSSTTSSSHKKHSKRDKEGRSGSLSDDKLDKKSKEILEQLVDNKIVPPLEDRLWKHVPQDDIVTPAVVESDSDHEPTSTVTIPTPPPSTEIEEQVDAAKPVKMEKSPPTANSGDVSDSTKDLKMSPASLSPPSDSTTGSKQEIWRGTINMIDVAQILITAHEVSGDCSGLGTDLPSNLDIVGRISPDTVWDYIGKMKCSNSKIISLLRLNATNVEEKMPYLALYSYLSSRNRLGVVKSTNKAVKDFYILPLSSQKPVPEALLPIKGPGFGEDPRPALLLGIIVRDKRKRPLDAVKEAASTKTTTHHKKLKVDVVIDVPQPPTRSYTPPPVKVPGPSSEAAKSENVKVKTTDDDDEPYSPADSDPDIETKQVVPEATKSFLDEPFSNKFKDIPGLGSDLLPSSTLEIERQMEKLNKEIEMQKSEINNISTEIGTTALASIALPSDLQQILDSIKTIVPGGETSESAPVESVAVAPSGTDFTIPLILPTTFTRPPNDCSSSRSTSNNKSNKNKAVTTPPPPTISSNSNSKKRAYDPTPLPVPPVPVASPAPSSVLGSLSEADLIRKAQEMLGESINSGGGNDDDNASKKNEPDTKRSKLELNQPPIPGIGDDSV